MNFTITNPNRRFFLVSILSGVSLLGPIFNSFQWWYIGVISFSYVCWALLFFREQKIGLNSADSLNEDHLFLLKELQNQASNQLQTSTSELKQIQNLLKNAIEKLHGSFSSLEILTSDQQGLVQEFALGAEEDQNRIDFRQFISKTETILSDFLQNIARTSEYSNELVGEMEIIHGAMSEIMDDVATIRSMAMDCHFLSVNALIEAAKADEPGFSVVADKINKLAMDLKGFNLRTVEHAKKVQTALDHANEEVKNISEKNGTFSSHAKVEATLLQEDIQSLNLRMISNIEELSGINGQIKVQVADSIMALQFEDMLRQLLQKVDERLRLTNTLLEDVTQSIQEGPSKENAESNKFREEALRLKNLFEKVDHVSVNQVAMDAGTVELF